MRTIFITALFICFTLHLYSQYDLKPGYIITLQSDTLFGSIKSNMIKKNTLVCEFREGGQEAFIVYQPGEISAFRISDEQYYISKNIGTIEEPVVVFVEYLIHSENVDLYFYRDKNQIDRYLIQKDSTIVEIYSKEYPVIVTDQFGGRSTKIKKNKQYIGVLRYIFRDQLSLQPEINRIALDHNSLINITKSYHDLSCPDGECIVYSKRTEKIKIKYSPEFSYNFTSINTLNIRYHTDRITYNTFLHPELSFGAYITFPATVKTLAIVTKIAISSFKLNYIEEFPIYSYELVGKANYGKATLGVRYSFYNETKFDPYLISTVGLGRSFNSVAKYRMLLNDEVPSDVDFIAVIPVLEDHIVLSVGSGCELEISAKIRAFLEVNYGMGLMVRGIVMEQGYMQNLSISSGLLF